MDMLRSTATLLLETAPSVMGFVGSELRRNSPVDNPVHFRLLRTLRRRQRSLHRLAEQHGVRLPTMSKTVSVLESRGWLERLRSTEDRRTVYVQLTQQGQSILEQVEAQAISRTSQLLECLPEESLANLENGLQALYEVVQAKIGTSGEEGAANTDFNGCEESTHEKT